MSNICFTDYYLFGKEEDIRKFIDQIEIWRKEGISKYRSIAPKDPITNSNWTGFILYGAGIWAKAPKYEGELQSSGTIVAYPDIEKEIKYNEELMSTYAILSTESPYFPRGKMWKVLIEKMNIDLKFVGVCVNTEDEFYKIEDPYGIGYAVDIDFALEYDIVEEPDDLRDRILRSVIPEESGIYLVSARKLRFWLQCLFNIEDYYDDRLNKLMFEAFTKGLDLADELDDEDNSYIYITPFKYISVN